MMIALTTLVLAVAGVGGQATAQSASLCGGADLVRGNVTMTLRILNAPSDLRSPYVHVRTRSKDGSYSLSAGYRPTEQGLGKPHIVHVHALVSFTSDADARPLRLEWREPGGMWFAPVSWTTPQRHFPNEEVRFDANYRMGQGEPFPHGTDVLDNMARGVRYEFRNVDEAGAIVSTGAADYPAQQVIEDMYATAREQAAARLRPCATGKVPLISSAPRNP